MKTNDQLLAIDSVTQTTTTRDKKKYIAVTLLMFIISIALAPLNVLAATADPTAVKWHPGHYYIIKGSQKNNAAYLSQVYSELDATPALNGMMIRYFWSDLEKSQGVYDFSSIDKRLAELTARNKRLVIQVQTKSFNNRQVVPNYMKTIEYEGGQFPFYTIHSNKFSGYNIKLWNMQVRGRLTALMRALGTRYNSHPYFEGISIIETPLGEPLSPLTNAQVTKFYDNWIFVHKQMRTFFPNTMTMQEVNYPRSIIKSFVTRLKDAGVALSSPDLLIEEPDLLFPGTQWNSDKGIYNYYSEFSGMMPMAPTVMPTNYHTTRKIGGYKPTITELLTFARDKLHANYIFWAREEHYQQVLQELNLYADKKKYPASGLNPACPKSYASCVE